MAHADLQVLVQDEGFVFARLRALGILVWFKTPTTQRARLVAGHLRDIAAGGFALLTIVTPPCAPVGADVRAIFDAGLRANQDSLLGTATVIQVEGVLGGLTRAISRAVTLVSRVPYPNNVYATVADAAMWIPQILSESAQPPPTPEEIVERVSAVLRRK
ncbi:hypothetical protein [Paraliomyxa miuraensis]|uniref:hypothetical protein n=1 Tax=Paraliomyxa miuraensis TaxID=376150 RepID=UPI00225437E7|nr:hypothetical protein [Paraliomyxa miuraensis]MCX4241937.1 hypothetical protein [Paraliomyxa miuraensis]